MLTVDEDRQSYLGIYLSVHPTNSSKPYYIYPNDTHNTKHCDQSNFDTCIIQFSDLNLANPEEVTIYFSIYSYS